MKEKILLITGGTGSFGNAVLEKLITSSEFAEIRIFSRDEKKQNDMRLLLKSPKVKFYIGDVRDESSIHPAMKNVDYVFHAAALKQVPSCEFFPIEAAKTNVFGTENVLNSAIANGVKKVVCLSTDKAAYPINAMGMSKALMEKVIIAKSRESLDTKIMITRYGNVMASRGSVIPLFVKQISEAGVLTVTNPDMTRFMMSLEDAVNLVLYAFRHGDSGDLFVQKSPAATIAQLVTVLKNIFNAKNDVEIIGTRHGEKLFETLLTQEEKIRSFDLGDYYKVAPDNRDLNYDKYFLKGENNLDGVEDYNSHNTYRLSNDELETLLLRQNYIKNELRKCND